MGNSTVGSVVVILAVVLMTVARLYFQRWLRTPLKPKLGAARTQSREQAIKAAAGSRRRGSAARPTEQVTPTMRTVCLDANHDPAIVTLLPEAQSCAENSGEACPLSDSCCGPVDSGEERLQSGSCNPAAVPGSEADISSLGDSIENTQISDPNRLDASPKLPPKIGEVPQSPILQTEANTEAAQSPSRQQSGSVPVYDETTGLKIDQATENEDPAAKAEDIPPMEQTPAEAKNDEPGTELQDPADASRDSEKATELKEVGNAMYKEGKYPEAMTEYKKALDMVPSKDVELAAMIINNMAAAHLALNEFNECIVACDEALELKPDNFKARIRRYRANCKLDKWHDALSDLKTALDLDPLQKQTYDRELREAEKKSQQQFDKEKDEMIGKLKEFGNWALGKVGMSLDNFKTVQDPKTGSYSIQYVNPGTQPSSSTAPSSTKKPADEMGGPAHESAESEAEDE